VAETGSVSNGTLQLTELTSDGIRWQVLPEWRHLLFGPNGLRLEEWLHAGLAQVVKNGPHRTVYRVVLPGLCIYLKHHRLPDVRAWLRQLVRPAKARMEFERALGVAARQVPTVLPVAQGVRCTGAGPSDSFLITQGLEDTESLSDFIEKVLPGLEPRRQTRLRPLLATALGEFVARLHDAGIVHKDLHAANLLVRLGPGDHPSLYLIDLHDVSLGRTLNWRASRANLVMLNRWFALRASRPDRFRFWRAYCRARRQLKEKWPGGAGSTPGITGANRPAFQDGARDLEERTWRSNLRFWRHRDRRCLVTNRYYYRLQSEAVVGCAVRDLDAGAMATLLADPDAPFRQPGVTLLKDSPSSTVAEFDLVVKGAVRRVIYKRFRVTAWSDPWLALLRRSPGLRSWVCGHGLRERCLPTARPLAVLHRRRGLLAYEGYLLCEKILGAVDLHRFLADLASLNEAERRCQLRRRIDQVARLICELHRRQVSQRDLKASNVLISQEAVWLIDLVGVASYRKLSWRRRIQNLARLHASFHQSAALTRTDKLRFLRVYLQWGLLGRNGWKRWWREIRLATQTKIKRNTRNGRPLA
jgi:tRNA A-37 threonylcarbamoyl transferase component Bud32